MPVFATVARAYGLLWQNRLLHAKAIWPPIIFLMTAEFLYHRVVGNADGLADKFRAILSEPWYMSAGAAVAWLAGLKFLLSFSISWRRHLLLGERFDPFFFKAPFWRYVGFLLLTYAWALPAVLLSLVPGSLIAATHAYAGGAIAAVGVGVPALAFVIWGIARQVPFFTVLALDPPQPGWRESTAAMRGTVLRYLTTFVIAMLPVVILTLLLDAVLKLADADRHSIPVALGESAFRQAMLFVHFSLGASIGAITTTMALPQIRTGSDPSLMPDA